MPLTGKKILITAGATYEPIDPVRFIGNRSTGKMGWEIAKACLAQNATVYLVLAHHQIDLTLGPKLHVFEVETADQMQQKCLMLFPQMDWVIKTAAVADYKPAHFSKEKIKKTQAALSIDLIPNPDILFELGKQKKHQKLIGFALETDPIEKISLEKMIRKNLDVLLINTLAEKNTGFGAQNQIYLHSQKGEKHFFALEQKEKLAVRIIEKLIHIL